MNWVDGSTEFKCHRRRSASFPDTAEITSSTYRFQKKGLTGEVATGLYSTSFISMLAMTAETGIVGAVVCKLRGSNAKRQQMNNILHRERNSLS